MATMSLAKNVFFNLSKAFPSPSPSRKISRVSFSSAFKPSQCRNSAEKNRDSRADFACNDKAWRPKQESRDTSSDEEDMSDRAKETVEQGMDWKKEKAQYMKEKAKEGTDREAETPQSSKERAKDYARDAKEKTKDAAGSMADKAKDGTYKAADTAKHAKERAKDEGHGMKEKTAEKAKETVQNIGEKAKETVDGAWRKAKETTQKIKETMMGLNRPMMMRGERRRWMRMFWKSGRKLESMAIINREDDNMTKKLYIIS